MTARLLIVEDHPIVAKWMHRLLRKKYDISIAKTVSSALSQARQKDFDIASVDVVLPGRKSGIVLASELKEMQPRILIALNSVCPDVFFDDPSVRADICIEKTLDPIYLALTFDGMLARRDMPQASLDRQRTILAPIEDCRKHLNFKKMGGDSDGAIRLEGALRDNKHTAWITYVDTLQNKNRVVVGLSSCRGCGLGCQFCYSALRRFEGMLSPDEMIAEFLIALEKSPQTVRACDGKLDLTVNWTCEGDPVLSNLDNVCQTIKRLMELKLGLKFILTTLGSEVGFSRLVTDYGHLPIDIYFSHHFRPEFRAYFLPATAGQDIVKMRDILQYYAERTNRTITVAWAVIDGINNRPEDVEFLAEMYANRPFGIKLTPARPGRLQFGKEIGASKLRGFGAELEKAGVKYRMRRLVGFSKSTCGETVPTYGTNIFGVQTS